MDEIVFALLNITHLIKTFPTYFDVIGHALMDLEKMLSKTKLSDAERLHYCINFHEDFIRIVSYLKDKRHIKFKINKDEISLLRFSKTVMEDGFSFDEYMSTVLNKTAKIFSDFMKGITFFKGLDPEVRRPIYHRPTSCGLSNNDKHYASNHLDCTTIVDNTDEYERRRRNVKNCLVERLVYDQLFRKYYRKQQNFGHSYQLLHLGHFNFKSCYPGSILTVHPIKFISDVPTSLTIEIVNNTKTVIEQYTKTVNVITGDYDASVNCYRIIVDKETHVKIDETKIQTYDLQKPWEDQQYQVAGGIKKMRVLGRVRRVLKIGNKNMIRYNGKFIPLASAKRIDKQRKS